MPYYPGSFLVARPTLRDPFFRQTVVLLLQHDAEGAFGLVINRPAPMEGVPYAIFFGGPCKIEGMLMLHGHPEWLDPDKTATEVCPGVFLGDPDSFEKISNDEDEESEETEENEEAEEQFRYRMFSGYAGWGPDQLEKEMSEGSWAVIPAHDKLVFDVPPEEVWSYLAPPAIPQPSIN